MKKIKHIIFVAVALLTAVSCLDKYPQDAIPADKAINTVDDANQFVIGIYASWKSSALYSGLLTLLPDIQSDLVYAVDGYSNTYGDVWRWEIHSDNSSTATVWAALYKIIGDCNFFFDYEPRVRASVTSDTDTENLDELCGEVHFMRSLAYAELIKCFCEAYDPTTADNELGVILQSSAKEPERFSKYHRSSNFVRSSLKDSYQFVLDGLAEAEKNILYDDVISAPYICKSLVNALYARTYLYMQDWDKAIEYSTKVIEDKALKLASAKDEYSGGESFYEYMWSHDAAYEIIWRIGFTETSYGGALGRVFLNYNYMYYSPDYVPAQWVLDLYSENDLRYDATFQTVTTGYSHGLTWPLLFKYNGNQALYDKGILHVCMPKPFRLAEQYLIRAEARCRKGDYTNAGRDITTLRESRYSTYSSTSINAANWLQTISDERVRELYMEGFRLQDLKRWGMGFTRVPQSNTVKEGSSLKVKGRICTAATRAGDPLFVWPIPQHELNVPGTGVKPNDSNK